MQELVSDTEDWPDDKAYQTLDVRDQGQLATTERLLNSGCFNMAGWKHDKITARKIHHVLRGKQLASVLVTPHKEKAATLEQLLRHKHHREIADVSTTKPKTKPHLFRLCRDETVTVLVSFQVGFDKCNCMLLSILAQIPNLPLNYSADIFRTVLMDYITTEWEDILEVHVSEEQGYILTSSFVITTWDCLSQEKDCLFSGNSGVYTGDARQIHPAVVGGKTQPNILP